MFVLEDTFFSLYNIWLKYWAVLALRSLKSGNSHPVFDI